MKTTGSKYDANLSVKEIAIRIRADLKAAIAAKTIPAIKTSVRMRHHSAIDVEVTSVPEGFQVVTKEFALEGSRVGVEMFTPEAKTLIVAVRAIREAYNYDDSEVMVDHFDVNYYGHAEFDWSLIDAQVKALKGDAA